jgi:RNA polymerase-binding transcription factor DksA
MSNAVSRYSDADLAEFAALIEGKIEKTKEQINLLQDQIMEITENSSDDFGGDWVDDSSTSSDVEMLNNMAIRQRKHLKDLENAMIRIRNKSYGICVVTGELIDKKRLLAVPTTTKSVAAKNIVAQPVKRERVVPKKKPGSQKEKEKKVITRVIRKTSSAKPAKPLDDELEDDDDLNLDDLLGDDEDSMLDFDDIVDESTEDMDDLDNIDEEDED